MVAKRNVVLCLQSALERGFSAGQVLSGRCAQGAKGLDIFLTTLFSIDN